MKIIFLALCVILVNSKPVDKTDDKTDDFLSSDLFLNLFLHVNKNVDRCDNFYDYACKDLPEEYRTSVIPIIERDEINEHVFENLLGFDDETPFEKKTRDFYTSCKNNKSPKNVFKQIEVLKPFSVWPTKSEHSFEDFSKLTAHLVKFLLPGFIMAYPNFKEHSVVVTIGYKNEAISVEKIAKLMTKFGVGTKSEIEAAAINVMDFHKKYQKIYETRRGDNDESEFYDLKNLDELNKLIPDFDWNSYFDILKTTFTDINFEPYPQKVENIEAVKKIIELIKNTDSKIVTDFLIYKFMDLYDFDKCTDEFLMFYRPMIAHKIWHKHITEGNKLELIKKLTEVEDMIKELQNLYPNATLPTVYDSEVISHIILNGKDFMSKELVKEFYDAIEISPNNLYNNVENFAKYIMKHTVESVYNENSVATDFRKTFMGEYDSTFNFLRLNELSVLMEYLVNSAMPFIIEKESQTETDDTELAEIETCLGKLNEKRSHLENIEFALYEHIFNIMDFPRSFYVVLVQQKCDVKTPEDNLFMRVWRNSPQFAKLFSCPVGTKMNKYGEDNCIYNIAKKIETDIEAEE